MGKQDRYALIRFKSNEKNACFFELDVRRLTNRPDFFKDR